MATISAGASTAACEAINPITWERMNGDPGSAHHDEPQHTSELAVTPASAKWRALFSFTRPAHYFALIPAILLSATAGILQPALAIFFGKFFNSFSDYGSGAISGSQLMQKTLIDVYALLGIGVATWVLKGSYFGIWMVFGELQAKSVRDELFSNLVWKDLAWFDRRASGVGPLLSRLQTYEDHTISENPYLHQTGRFEKFSWVLHSH